MENVSLVVLLMRFVFKACSCVLLFICMRSIVQWKKKEKNETTATLDPDLPAGPVHVLAGPGQSMMDWFPLTASTAATNWTWGRVVWMLAVLKKNYSEKLSNPHSLVLLPWGGGAKIIDLSGLDGRQTPCDEPVNKRTWDKGVFTLP